MALYQLIYISSLATEEPELLSDILNSSIRNNTRNGVTGMMLFAEGSIMQALEGEKDTVLETYRVIESDPRHSGLFVLIEQEIAARQFGAWSMGYRHLTKSDLEKFPLGASVFKSRTDEISLRVRPGDALTVLKSFADGSISVV